MFRQIHAARTITKNLEPVYLQRCRMSSSMGPSGVPKPALQEIMNREGQNGWETCWKDAVTPWDLKGPTPIIAKLATLPAAEGGFPIGKVLIPGCGSGYDVRALAEGSPDRTVTGLDLSATAVERAKAINHDSPASDRFNFMAADFFTFTPEGGPFDAIFDYTFLCALPPHLREGWAKRMSELLKPSGELFTLIFPIADHQGGPPYAMSLDLVKSLLEPLGFRAYYLEPNSDSHPARAGKEYVGRWRRQASASL